MFKISYYINVRKFQSSYRYALWALDYIQDNLKIDIAFIKDHFERYGFPLEFNAHYQYGIYIEKETESGWKMIHGSTYPHIGEEQFQLLQAFIDAYIKKNYKKSSEVEM